MHCEGSSINMSEQTPYQNEIERSLKKCRKYLGIALKSKSRSGIYCSISALRSLYRNNLLNKESQFSNNKLEEVLWGLKLIIRYYGRLGGDIVDAGYEDDFDNYMEFPVDLLGQRLPYDDRVDEMINRSDKLEYEENKDKLKYEKYKRLFLVCCKAYHKGLHSFIYKLIERMEQDHPGSSTINKDALRDNIFNNLESFWGESISISDKAVEDVFGFAEHSASHITKCYLVLRTYSRYKGITNVEPFSSIIPVSDKEKIRLADKLESLVRNQNIIHDAYEDLKREEKLWNELFKGKFVETLDETMKVINRNFDDMPLRAEKLKAAIPLDTEKMELFKTSVLNAFNGMRKKMSWLNYSYADSPVKPYQGHFSCPRDLFIRIADFYLESLAHDFAKEFADKEEGIVIEYLRQNTESVNLDKPDKEIICDTIIKHDLLSQEVTLLVHQRPKFESLYDKERDSFYVEFGDDKSRKLYIIYSLYVKPNEAFVFSTSTITVKTAKSPLTTFNEIDGKVEFCVDFGVPEIVLLPDNKYLRFMFKS